jgi:hypothetical protein
MLEAPQTSQRAVSSVLYTILVRLDETKWLTSRLEYFNPAAVGRGRPPRSLHRIPSTGLARASLLRDDQWAPRRLQICASDFLWPTAADL